MTFSPGDPNRHLVARDRQHSGHAELKLSDTVVGRESGTLLMLDVEPDADPGVVVLTCANCGAAMDERKCKLICRCGYFLSCSDYY